MSRSSTASGTATWAAPSKRRSRKSEKQVQLPRGYHINWEGEYESEKRAEARLFIIVPLTIFFIFLIIYGAFGSAKWACLHLVNVGVARVGGLMALYTDRDALQRIFRRRLYGFVRCFHPDWRHHGRIHQSVALARNADRGSRD
jgi:Cu/Ag efflux pump CusA